MPTRATPAIKKPEPAPKPPAPAPRPPAPAPVAATAPRVAAGPPAVRLGAPAAKGGATEGAVAPGVVELKGMSDFKPAAPVTEFLDANKTSTINARFGDLAQGPLEVKTAGKGKYRVKKQPLPLSHPAFAFVPQFVPGLTPALIIGVENNKLVGEVGLASGAKVQRISSFIQKTPDMLGLAGFTIGTLPTIVNAIEGGSLHFGLKAVPIKLGSAFSGKFNFDVIDTNVSFDANAAVVVKGLANGTLDLKRAPSGLITGRAAIGLSLSQNFSGSVDVAWDGVAITGIGKVGYKGEKFSGEVTLQMMERNQALQLAQSKQSPPAGAAKAAAAKKPVKIDYVVFGEGDLNFSFTEWLNGTAHVIVDPKGNVTVIGKITPQKEFILFPQKDYIRPLFKFEARASYGIPVVGNIFIFANVGMDLFAKLGPAKFYNIVVDGTYSTDPTVAKNFTIQGSLNISAAAGARLRAEAGAGLEILSHDIKAGAGINGIAGIKAYAEATPVIGYREKAVEGQDTKGEWFVRGDLELAAQPFLGLSGDLFVEISTPWWSPLSDHRWTWPLFSKEWPLGSSMGMLVSVDYVFGSGQWPKFDLKPVEFDSNKFITGLYDDSAKSGPGKELEQKGKWQEKNSAAAQPPPKGTQTGSAKPGKLDSGKAKTKQGKAKKLDKAVDPNAKTKEGKSVSQLKDEAQKKGKGPKGKVDAKAQKGKDPAKDGVKDAIKDDGKAIKNRVRAELAGKTITSARQADELLTDIYKRYSPLGLKGIRLTVNPARPAEAHIRVSASAAEEVALLPVTATGAREALAYAYRFRLNNPTTVLYVYYDEDHKRFGEVINNEPELPGNMHAEDMFERDHLPSLLRRIAAERAAGTLVTPPNKPVKVALDLNRLPCPRCSAGLIPRLAKAHPDLQFVVRASSVSPSGTLQKSVPVDSEIHIGFIEDMIRANVQVEPLHIHEAIWVKVQQVGLAAGAKKIFLRTGSLAREVTSAKELIKENSAETRKVEEMIEAAKRKAALPKVPPKGSGA